MQAIEVVNESRKDRYTAYELIEGVSSNFIELHGDREGTDDKSIVGGIGIIDQTPVTFIAIDKGQTIQEKIEKENGSPLPAGYRKAKRLMEQADKFHRPIVTFINTPGAYPGKEAEKFGQGGAIAKTILKSLDVKVPVISIIYGEGGSGGALALATGNEVWMLERTTYSILSPEGFASILWKDSSLIEEAAENLKLTPDNLLSNGIVDKVIREEPTKDMTIQSIKNTIVKQLKDYHGVSGETLKEQRMIGF